MKFCNIFILTVLLMFFLTSVGFSGESGIFTSPSIIATFEPFKLGMKKYIKLVREKNQRILVEELGWKISREEIQNAKSIFEPNFLGSYQYELNHKKNTAEEIFSRGYRVEFEERNIYYNAALEGLLPTGGQLRLNYALVDISNTTTKQSLNLEQEFQTLVNTTLIQPLLKNGGWKATMANIRITEAGSAITFQTYRQNMMLVIARAAAAYWDLYTGQEKYKARMASIKIAQDILWDNRERVRTGKMAETEVLEAEVGLSIRKSLASAAKQDLIDAIYTVRNYFSSSGKGSEARVVATDKLEIDSRELNFGVSFWKTINLRPEYLSAKIKMKREDIRIAFAKNQRLPQVDLKASYGLNGLDQSAVDSWDDAAERDFTAWSLGLDFQVPLGGGKKSRSELKAARHRKAQALHEFKAVEVALVNAVDTAIQSVYNSREQVGHYKNARDLNQQLLEVEIARLDAGKSNSRLVLEKEENLNNAIDAELESLIKYKRAVLSLEMAEGSLLRKFGIEEMEIAQ